MGGGKPSRTQKEREDYARAMRAKAKAAAIKKGLVKEELPPGVVFARGLAAALGEGDARARAAAAADVTSACVAIAKGSGARCTLRELVDAKVRLVVEPPGAGLGHIRTRRMRAPGGQI